MKINNVDMGVNIIDEQMYERIKDVVKLQKPRIQLHSYDSKKRYILSADLPTWSKRKMTVAEFYVVAGRSG